MRRTTPARKYCWASSKKDAGSAANASHFAADLSKSQRKGGNHAFRADAWLPSDAIRGELAVWRTLLAEGATECASWSFPEHAYKGPGLDGPALARHQTGTLKAARSALLATKPDLAPFLRTDAEIEAIDRPIVR